MKLKNLSDNASVESILADIPFFAVGLMAFGIFTFFLLIGAVSRWVVAIHLASAVAFIGSILDLSDILVHGSPVIQDSTALLELGPLGTAREILYAIANGILFLFLWLLVAQPPPNEYSVDEDGLHSGSWGKWGLLGTVLKIGLAVSAFAIAILQILYRAIPAFHVSGPVYQIECTIRIIVSAVLLLKLLLNTYLAVLSSRGGIPRWKTLRDYFPAMIAIGIGLGLAIADLVHFMMSSNVLGTFLTGIEMYILLLYVLISSFYHIRHAIRGTKKNHLRSSSFNGLRPMTQQDYFLRISPAQVPQMPSSPDFLSMGPSGDSGETQANQPPNASNPSNPSNPSNSNYSSVNEKSRTALTDGRRASAASRLSSWLHPRNLASRLPSFSSPSPQLDDERLWGGDEAERGESPLGLVENSQEVEVKGSRNSIDTGLSPLEPKESAKWQDPVFTSVLRGVDSNSNFRRTGSPQSIANLTPLTIPPRAFSRPMTPMSPGTDSPIYGLGGVVRARIAVDSPLSVLTPPPRIPLPETPEPGQVSRATSISYLFREQAELDKTIANLKGLSISSSSDRTSSSDAVLSASLSEFSLSNFPSPPLRDSVDVGDMSTILAAAGIAETPAPPIVTIQTEQSLTSASGNSREGLEDIDEGDETETEETQDRSRSQGPSPATSELLPPTMPAAEHSRTASVPFSDDGNDSIVGTTRVRMDSMGTQYEITSFIGDLTKPGQPQSSPATSFPGSVSSSPLRSLSDNPLTQPGSSSSNLSVSPLTALQMSTRANLRVPPMVAGQSVSGLPISRPMIGLPSGPRMGVRGALSPLRERMSPTDEFEHPRPAPVPAPPASSSPTGNSTNSREPPP